MGEKIKLYEKGLEKYPKSGITLGNIAMLLLIALGTITIWFFYPLLAWLYLAFTIIMVYIVLRKLVCTNCYYYDKWCSIGWGKLSAKLFKKGKIEEFNNSVGLKLAPLIYGLLLMIIPIVLIIISIVLVFNYYKVGVLVLLLLLSIYSGGIGRKSACSRCKMRLYCRGSAVK